MCALALEIKGSPQPFPFVQSLLLLRTIHRTLERIIVSAQKSQTKLLDQRSCMQRKMGDLEMLRRNKIQHGHFGANVFARLVSTSVRSPHFSKGPLLIGDASHWPGRTFNQQIATWVVQEWGSTARSALRTVYLTV